MTNKISYARGFPYGAPLAMIRGGATKREDVREFLKAEGFRWGSRYAWEHYLGRQEFGAILKRLRDDFGCTVEPKADMDSNYRIDLDDPKFSRPRPKLPLFDSGNPNLAAECDEMFGSGKKVS